jgi:hypothetical protein
VSEWLTARSGQVTPAFMDEMRRRCVYAVLHAIATADEPVTVHEINLRIGLYDIIKVQQMTDAQKAARLTRMRSDVSETALWLSEVGLLKKLPKRQFQDAARFSLTFEGFIWYAELSQ